MKFFKLYAIFLSASVPNTSLVQLSVLYISLTIIVIASAIAIVFFCKSKKAKSNYQFDVEKLNSNEAEIINAKSQQNVSSTNKQPELIVS